MKLHIPLHFKNPHQPTPPIPPSPHLLHPHPQPIASWLTNTKYLKSLLIAGWLSHCISRKYPGEKSPAYFVNSSWINTSETICLAFPITGIQLEALEESIKILDNSWLVNLLHFSQISQCKIPSIFREFLMDYHIKNMLFSLSHHGNSPGKLL
jgi:hypothetical protein